ncbi:hypothetical protein CKO_01430 [Citrobacter koseri ATCC BAA-895]|uniref:Uncharacterized protein n=1 Tax=Citrobacter koseri (strain ATCC BAA-895 / CDC 4225-83 / SGSC4696) TaxID=290338 RepID=A8AGF1_CITK8|nr:hypothetical protein CKO_01430 [Citrobacter koseri ATCC BAA-895]
MISYESEGLQVMSVGCSTLRTSVSLIRYRKDTSVCGRVTDPLIRRGFRMTEREICVKESCLILV